MGQGFGVRALITGIGFAAAVVQIVLLRELLVVFYGDEITIGLTLASWLVWTAAGSMFGGRLAGSRERHVLAAILVFLAVLFPGTVLAVRTARGMLQTVPGEVLSPAAMLGASLILLGPLCALAGALFPVAGRVFGGTVKTAPGAATSSVYLWEAVGASAGGLIAGLVLLRLFGSLAIAFWIAVLYLMMAGAVAPLGRYARFTAVAVVGALATLLAVREVPQRWERASQERYWSGQRLLATRTSPYGSLAMIATGSSRSVYENGVVLFTVPDPEAAEESVHYALLEHPSPRSLLLIGGGLNGSIREALRHPSLERVDYVELDPAILDLSRDCLPADERVHIHAADGRRFVNQATYTFDVVIVNLPGPRTAQLNRFYTAEFFQEVVRRLTPSGLLSFQLAASENYISPPLGQLLASIHATLKSVFPEVETIPGSTVHFFATSKSGVLAKSPEELLSRLRARNLGTSFVSESFIPYRMAPDRMRELQALLANSEAAPVNRDLAPIAYYLAQSFWSSRFHPGSSPLLGPLATLPFLRLIWGLALVVAFLLAARWRTGSPARRQLWSAGCCTAAAGFSMMTAEILLLLGFQAVYGYVYERLALLIAAFMAGMALGAWLALRRPASAGTMSLAVTQILVAAAPVAVTGLVAASPATAAMFPFAALACGILGGLEFPLAGRIFFRSAPGGSLKRVGALYGLDLVGSALAAIAVSAWLVPVFGFFKTAWLALAVSLAPAGFAFSTACGTDRAAAEHPSALLQKPQR